MTFKVAMASTLPVPEAGPAPEEILSKAGAEFTKAHCETEDEIIAFAHDADVLIVSGLERATRRVIRELTRCRAIYQTGIGCENIDVEAATEHGICVANVPDFCLEEVSDHTMALILACARRLFELNREGKAGRWAFPHMRRFWAGITRLRGQTLGLVGFGNIPRTLVPKARGFGLRIIACDPYVPQSVAEDFGVELVPFDHLLKESDFVSIHAPLTAETHHLFGEEQFKKMKPTAYLINTARGPLVEEQALYNALTQGQIAGAAIDVMEIEPPDPENPLFKLDNLIATAHSAHASTTSFSGLWRRVLEDTVKILQGEWPRSFVNPEVKERFVAKWGKPG